MCSQKWNLKIILTIGLIALNACSLLKPVERSEDGWLDWDGRGGWNEASKADGLLAAGESSSIILAPESAPVEDEAGMRSGAEMAYQSAPLRAGSVDNNHEWDDYLLYRLQFRDWGITVHDLEINPRYTIKVINQEGMPVLGALVEIFDQHGEALFTARTGADGTVYFFPEESDNAGSATFEIQATKDGVQASATASDEQRERTLELNVGSSLYPIRLDVHFLIDATGSMSDEISQLKENMISVAERIASMHSNPDVRYGMTIYRDRGDLFISRTFDFTPDVVAFTDALREVQAEGGGDYPESLNEGLHQALHMPEWRVEETVSLLFLIADAPPHLDYAQDYDYAQDVFTAVEGGIKIFPLASSGLDDQGEYIFRQLAQITGGKFLFLTYGPGGAPGDDTTHHVDDYSVLSLDDLVVRLVEEQLSYLSDSQQ